MDYLRKHHDVEDLLTGEIERIVARELESLRDELSRLRQYLGELEAVLEPW